MDAGGQRGKAKSEINVTPLIDIVLVLLIVFIVLVPGLTKALPVTVPRVVRTAPAPEHNPPLVVTVDAGGGLLLQSDRIELSRLAQALVPVVQLQPAGMRRVFLGPGPERDRREAGMGRAGRWRHQGGDHPEKKISPARSTHYLSAIVR